MKAILVVDMPDNCAECQFCGFGGKDLEKYVCCLTKEYSDDTHMVGCPLKPMPQKKEIEWSDSFGKHNYKKGFNECIDEILGEKQ